MRPQIKIVCGDITTFEGDIVVNAANSIMLGGGGVDGAIHRAAGPDLRAFCENIRPRKGEGLGHGGVPISEEVRCPVASVVPTPGFNLKAPWIFHAVAPKWDPDGKWHVSPACLAGFQMKFGATSPEAHQRQQMRDIYKKALLMAVSMDLKSIAYPAMGCGVFGWSHEVLADLVMNFVQDYAGWPVEKTFYLYPADSLPIWEAAARKYGIEVEITRG